MDFIESINLEEKQKKANSNYFLKLLLIPCSWWTSHHKSLFCLVQSHVAWLLPSCATLLEKNSHLQQSLGFLPFTQILSSRISTGSISKQKVYLWTMTLISCVVVELFDCFQHQTGALHTSWTNVSNGVKFKTSAQSKPSGCNGFSKSESPEVICTKQIA